MIYTSYVILKFFRFRCDLFTEEALTLCTREDVKDPRFTMYSVNECKGGVKTFSLIYQSSAE